MGVVARVVREFLERLVVAYREREQALSDLAERPVQPNHRLSAPVQLVAIEVKEPEFTVILKVHSPDRPDGEMHVYEDVERWNLWRTLEEVLALDLWSAPLRTTENESFPGMPCERSGLTLRGAVQPVLERIHHDCRRLAMQEPKSEPDGWWPGQADSMAGDGAAWFIHGDVEHLGLERIVDELVKYRVEPPRPPPDPPPKRQVKAMPRREKPYDGHGGYHNLGLLMGQTDDWSLNKLVASRAAMPGALVFEDTLGPHPFLATHNGFLGVLESEKQEALRWLNLLGCAMLQDGIQTHAFRDTESGSFYDPRERDHDSIIGWGGRWPSQPPEHWDATWVSDDEMRGYLRAAEALSKKPYATHLPLLLEAHTHHTTGQPAQSLIFSWAIIEQQMVQRWDQFLGDREVATKRKGQLGRWNISNTLEALNLAGALSDKLYGALEDARKIRNKALHGTKFPDQREAKHVLDAAEMLLIPAPDHPVRAPPKPQILARPVRWL